MSIKLYHPETRESLVIVPRYGGTVTSLVLGEKSHEVLRNDSLFELERNPLFRGRFLFPFNDRIPGGRYTFRGKEYQLPVNCREDGSAIHGFLYRERMDVAEQSETRAVLTWRTDNTFLPGYPFVLSLTIVIELYGGGVAFSFSVKNRGTDPAPFAFGWHSYFNMDSSTRLHAAYPCFFRTDSAFLPIGECCDVNGTDFNFSGGPPAAGKKLDHTFRAPPDGVTILAHRDYSVRIRQDHFPYTQLFVPPENDSIAVEPITSKPNSFNDPAVLILAPEEEYSAGITIDVV